MQTLAQWSRSKLLHRIVAAMAIASLLLISISFVPRSGAQSTSDTDGDGISDSVDNCPTTANASQADNEKDGKGDECDTDDDGDWVDDTVDNCPKVANGSQKDTDGDKMGDECDSQPTVSNLACTGYYLSTDKSSYAFSEKILLTYTCASQSTASASNVRIEMMAPNSSTGQEITTLATASSGTQSLYTSQLTNQVNGSWMIRTCIGGNCSLGYTNSITVNMTGGTTPEVDSDGDGFSDSKDNCPITWNSSQTDTDKDGKGDYCDDTPNGSTATCTSLSLKTDKTSYNFGESMLLTYNCVYPSSTTNASSIEFEVMSPSNTIQDLETLSNVVGGTKWIGTNDFKEKTTGNWGIRACIGGCSSGYPFVTWVSIGNSTAGTDSDGDGFPDSSDNCPTVWNSSQTDSDHDGKGDYCDNDASTTADSDGDGLKDASDNCPYVYNPTQEDKDGDKMGTACDTYEPGTVTGQDSDGDGFPDSSDNCPNNWNSSQTDTDKDGKGDYCDTDASTTTDSDGDGLKDAYDNCPHTYNPNQEDTDKDGIGKACDQYEPGTTIVMDSDGDGFPDSSDNCPNNWNSSQTDTDKDGKGDYCDNDSVITPPPPTPGGCQNTTESGLQCSLCSDASGKMTSKSCWSNSTSTQTSYCDYYKDNGLDCMSCNDKNGNVMNKSCWTDSYDSWNDYYYEDKVRCDYVEQPMEDNYHTPYAASYSTPYYPYQTCEICKKPDGTVVQDSCNQKETPPGGGGDYCEYYMNDKGLSCKTCYDNKGNFKEEFCDEIDTGGKHCQWEDPDGDDLWCEICYDEAGNQESERCDSGNTGNEANPEEVERQLKDMQENIHWRNQDLKEYKRMAKQIDRKVKEIGRKIKSIDQDERWMQEEGIDISGMEAAKANFEQLIQDLQNLKPGIEADQKSFEEELRAEQRLIDSLGSHEKVQWDELDAMWVLMRKSDKFQLVRDIWQFKMDYFERLDNMVFQYEREKAQVLAQLEHENIEMEEDLLEDSEQWIEEFYELYQEVMQVTEQVMGVVNGIPPYQALEQLVDRDTREEFREYFDDELMEAWDDLRFAREDWNFHDMDQQVLWDSLSDLNHLKDRRLNQQWIQDEIVWIREDIEKIEAGLQVLDGRLDSGTQSQLEDVLEVIPRAWDLLDEAEEMLEDDSGDWQEMEENNRRLWDKLDAIGSTVDPKLRSIMDYVERQWDELNLSDSDRQIVEEMIDHMNEEDDYDHDGPGCGRRCGQLQQYYGQDVAQMIQNIREEIVTQIVNEVTAAVMEEVVKYLEREVAGKIIENVLAHFETLGGMGNQLLENTNTVLEEVTALNLEEVEVAEEVQPEVEELVELQEEFETVPVPSEELAVEIATAWEDVNTALETEPTRAELQNGIETLEELLARAEQSKFEEGLAYHDVPFIYDEAYDPAVHWYSEYVIGNTQSGLVQGYKDENGNLKYEFGPSDTTLRAEVLKMSMLAAGYKGSGTGSNWWSPYENQARELGLSIVNLDLSQPVTRGEMMRLMFELGDMEGSETFHGYFPDVKTTEDWQPAEALFEAEIVMGQGGTGFADLYSQLNRAESSTIVQRFAAGQKAEELLEETGDNTGIFERPSTKELQAWKAQTEEQEGGFFNWIASLLKALLPVF